MDSNYVDDLIDEDEIPELTAEDFARMIPFSNLPQEEHAFLDQIKNATYPDTAPVEEVTLSRPVLERFCASGTGWETRVDEALRQWIEEHQAS